VSLARRFAFVAFFVTLAAFACAVPAFAHARLVEAFPDEGNEFSESPGQIQLRFSEPVEAVFDPIVVHGEDGERVDLDNARLDPENPEVVAVDLEDGLPMGRYEVEWRVTSEDGHPIEDNYEFVVNTSAEDDSPDERTPVERVSESGSSSGLETGVVLGGALAVVAATVGFVVIRRN
jgi:copper resistance protein C